MSRAPRTLIEVVYARTGSFRETAKACKLVTGWRAALYDLGRDELTIGEYVEWADPVVSSRATTYRQLEAFRKAFPRAENPNQLCAALGPLVADELDPLVELPATFAVA